MAHLEKLFFSEGPPDRPYHSLDSRTMYKSETATAESREVKQIKEIRPVKKEFHPIATEIHVTELRPIKLDPIGKRAQSVTQYPVNSHPNPPSQMWERRLQSESALTDTKPQVMDHSFNNEYHTESHSESRSQTLQSHHMSTSQRNETADRNEPAIQSSTIRTVTSRGGSYSGSSPGSSPAGTLSPPVQRRDHVTAEFKRRDVSPDFKMTQQQQNVRMVDGKCQCCPYGYHVDVDFMSYCDTMSNQSYLKQLKKIQREKRKLRKSMEVYLQEHENTDGRTELVNPMQNHPHYQEATTNMLLDEIDTSVDQTLSSIETMMLQSKQQQTYSDTGSATVNAGPQKFNTFPKKVGRQVAKELQNYNETFTATFNNTDRADSNSSLSSISTAASERPQSRGYMTTETTTTRTSNVTSQQLAETMATHFPMGDGAASPQSNMTNISKESLNAIREAMAVSLQRMKDLEEQIKAIPVLQVRISVLKEEKRLLGLQMRADQQVNTISRGVGDSTVEPPISPRFEYGPKSPPPVAPKPKKTRTAAVGDHSVLEAYLLQEDLPSSYTTQDNSTHVFERETIIIDRAQKQHAMYMPESPKPLTRTVGVGEGNVLDDSLHIHEKELRTVIIGQSPSAGKRNVGIECRVPTRDVGVSYNFDSIEKPATRTVGITTETSALVTSVSFKSEEFTSALKNALSKSVRSVGVQASSRQEVAHVGIQYSQSMWSVRTIGVGDHSVDVEVRNPVARRSVSVDAFPDRMNRSVNTDYGWRLDACTNTVSQFMETSCTQTEQPRTYNSFTMTDRTYNFHAMCQTDFKVFAATDQVRSLGTNTERVLTYNSGMNTVLKPLADRGVNTSNQKNTRNIGANTDGPNVRNIGVSDDRIDSFVCDLDEEKEDEYRFEEEGVETKTVYYATAEDRADTKTDKGYEIKREYSGDTFATQSSQRQESAVIEEEDDQNEEIVEEKVWRTHGDGQFTVTTVTTRRILGAGADGTLSRETKTVTGGPEVLGSDAAHIQKEVARGLTSGGSIDDSSLSEVEYSMSSSPTVVKGSNFSQLSEQTGASAIERVLGTTMYTHGAQDDSFSSSRQTSSREVSLGGQSSLSSMASSLGSELDDLRQISDSGMSSSDGSSSSTSYKTYVSGVGSPTVKVTEKQYTTTREGSPQREAHYSSSYDSGLSSSGGSMGSSSSSEIVSTTITSSSHFSDSGSPSGTLKSIMKKSTSDPGQQKRGITFAETVMGGESDEEGASESSDNSDDDEEEDGDDDGVEVEAGVGVEENGSRGTTSDSDSSYDEGCYDSREGSIVYKCKDDEAIANGIPGAKMFDQNIRETFELSGEMKDACTVLATYLEDSTTIQTKQLNSSLSVIQKEWFKVSSSKLAEAHQVEDYLSCFNEISKRLLEYIVNIQDSNGNTAIHYAVSNCNFEIVNLLLDTGICDLNKLNKAGYTTIIMATLASVQTERQEEVVQRLFSMGNVNVKAAKDGQTALMFAVRQGRTEMVKMLLDTGADTNTQDDEGSTALMCAAEHGHTEICKMLLNTPSCDASIVDNDGSTALSIAMEAGHKDAGVLLYAHVNFGPGQSPAPTRKTRKTSSTSSMTSPT